MTAARLGMSMTLAGLEPASFASEGDASLITPWGLVKPKPLKTRVEHMRTPGVEPGSQAWEACMMPLHYVRQCDRRHQYMSSISHALRRWGDDLTGARARQHVRRSLVASTPARHADDLGSIPGGGAMHP